LARRVTAPDGRRWKVRRRWVAYERRVLTREGVGDAASSLGIPLGPDDVGVLGFVVGAIALLLLAALAVVVALELVLVLVLVPAALLGRIALGRPWPVVARSGGERHRWEVRGWRASGRHVDAVADAISRGRELPRGSVGA
jgi:hypothetical protein